MSTTVTLDKAGRVVLPKALRDELHLQPGDSLEIETDREGFVLRPVRSSTPMRKERGVWVFRAGGTLSTEVTNKVLADIREERDRRNRGEER